MVFHLLLRAIARKGEEAGRRQHKSLNADSFNNHQAPALSCCQESSVCVSFFNPDSSPLRLLSPYGMVINVFMPVQTASSLQTCSFHVPHFHSRPFDPKKKSAPTSRPTPSVLFFRKPCLFHFQYESFSTVLSEHCLNLYYGTYQFDYSP